jgi:hypothetical protein
MGVSVEEPTSVATVEDSVIEQTRGTGLKGTTGLHLVESTLTLRNTALVANEAAAFAAYLAPAHVEISSSLFIGTTPTPESPFGRGVDVEQGACLELKDSAIVGSTGIGLFLIAGAASPCDAHATGLVVLDSNDQANGEATRGVSVQGGRLLLESSAVISRLEAGLFLSDAAMVKVSRSMLRGLPAPQAPLLNLVVAHEGDELRFTDSFVDGSPSIGLAIGGARGSFWGGAISRNGVALSAFRGTTLQLTDTAPGDGPIAEHTLLVDSQTRFIDNATKLGSGDVPLPDPLPSGR